jgi:hypothetical protein
LPPIEFARDRASTPPRLKTLDSTGSGLAMTKHHVDHRVVLT